MSGRVVKYKDLMVAKGTELYDAIVEKKDNKLAEKLYKKLEDKFKKDYPQCTKEWFASINDR